jgi:hypothetical protein
MTDVLVVTCDKYLWSLEIFVMQFQKYWGVSKNVVIAGFSSPKFSLPRNFTFINIGTNQHPQIWSNGVKKALEAVEGDFVIWMMDDYWLTRRVDRNAVEALELYMKDRPDIARGDLTSDRLYAADMRDVEPFGHLDIIECVPPAQYHLSFQAGIWRKSTLLSVLRDGESPWQVELDGTNRMKERGLRVVGTRQLPVRYFNGVQGGKLVIDKVFEYPQAPILDEDRRDIKRIIERNNGI